MPVAAPVESRGAGRVHLCGGARCSLEGGYRLLVTDALSLDLAVFENDYDDLQTRRSFRRQSRPIPRPMSF